MSEDINRSKREFMKLSALAGSSLLFTSSMNLFAATNPEIKNRMTS